MATADFTERVKRIIDDMKLKTGAFIKEVQLEMEQFSAALKVYAMAEFERFAQMGDDVNNNDMD